MKAALYARVSTNDQNPEMQKNALIKKAELEGWEYDYVEEIESSRNNRPKKYRVYQEAVKGKYDIICVWKLDRWGRSLQEMVREMDTMVEHSIQFISITDAIDVSTASGRLQYNMLCALAEFERDLIRERTKEALDYRKKQIEKKGYFINKNGKKITSLGRPKGSKDKKRRRKSGYYIRWSK